MHVTIWEFLGILLQAIIISLPALAVFEMDRIAAAMKRLHRYLWK